MPTFSSSLRFMLVLALALALRIAAAAPVLPALGVMADQATVSGISSGGYMAVQFHVAHPSIRAGGCRVHVAFHGGKQGREQIGELFARRAGYNRRADSNRIVVLYPQAIARHGRGPWPRPTSFVFNPNGCWDGWGYTGVNDATKVRAQIRAVKAMLDRLAAKP